VTVVATACLLAACSSNSKTGHVEGSFLKVANAACMRALQLVAPQPFPYPKFDPATATPDQLRAVGTYLDTDQFSHKELAIAQTAGTPHHGTQTWQHFLDLIAQQQALVEKQITAGKAADRTAFQATVADIKTLATQIDTAASDVGFAKTAYCVQLYG
jgi:hypothetical protein